MKIREKSEDEKSNCQSRHRRSNGSKGGVEGGGEEVKEKNGGEA